MEPKPNPNPNSNPNHKSTIYAVSITGLATVLAAMMSSGVFQHVGQFFMGSPNAARVSRVHVVPDKKYMENKHRLDSLSKVDAKIKEDELKRTIRMEMMKNEKMVADNSDGETEVPVSAGSNSEQ